MALVLVHGGAGARERGSDALARAVAACERAASAGLAALVAGAPLDGVEAAVIVMEDDPQLNAGRGAHPKADGIVELDAMVMDGATLAYGAVAAVPRVLHPVSLARRVMSDTPHSLLVGEGASRFADAIGFPRCANEDLLAPRETPPPAQGTVGAVAIDDAGNVAAATSTGGVRRQLPGRVGDSPIAGAGGYAENESGAVSATGDGEAFLKLALSRRACGFMERGLSAQAASTDAIALLGARLGATGGLIAVDRAGRTGVAFNTPAMPWALASSDGERRSGSAAP